MSPSVTRLRTWTRTALCHRARRASVLPLHQEERAGRRPNLAAPTYPGSCEVVRECARGRSPSDKPSRHRSLPPTKVHSPTCPEPETTCLLYASSFKLRKRAERLVQQLVALDNGVPEEAFPRLLIEKELLYAPRFCLRTLPHGPCTTSTGPSRPSVCRRDRIDRPRAVDATFGPTAAAPLAAPVAPSLLLRASTPSPIALMPALASRTETGETTSVARDAAASAR